MKEVPKVAPVMEAKQVVELANAELGVLAEMLAGDIRLRFGRHPSTGNCLYRTFPTRWTQTNSQDVVASK